MRSDNVDRDGFAPRAGKGGAFGANGAFYRGGQFIANSENTIKGGGLKWDAPQSEPPAWVAERDAEIARAQAWVDARVAEFADLLSALEAIANPLPVYESFEQSLARQFRVTGSLSPRQAECAVKSVFGRRVKANADKFDAMVEALKVRYEAAQ